jgi:uncharacterized protein (TIGR00661 family)
MTGTGRLKIAYGVMGYGRGHATRVRSVLPALLDRHDVTVFAGGDALPVLAPLAPTVRIPTLGYVYGHGGDLSIAATVGRNFGGMSDLLLGGQGLETVVRQLRDGGFDLVISDSEAWTHRAAQRLGLPRISFDHVGIIAWCKPHFPSELWLRGRRDGWVYGQLMGRPDRILICSFYAAEPLAPGTRVIGPVLREELRQAEPRDLDFLLVYLNKGRYQYTAGLDLALRRLDATVVIYGTPYRGRVDNLEFRPPSNSGFIRDLASCRAVLSTAGNQLISEAIHFRKPVMALPENVFEQQLNARMVERMGIGARGRLASLTVGDVEDFLVGCDGYRARMPEVTGDGRAEAARILMGFIDELRVKPRMQRTKRLSQTRNKALTHWAPS